MCEAEGTRGGVGPAEDAGCGNGGKGTGGLCQWFRWGKVDKIKWGETLRQMLGWEEAERR